MVRRNLSGITGASRTPRQLSPGEASRWGGLQQPGNQHWSFDTWTTLERVTSKKNPFKNIWDTNGGNKIQPQFLKAPWPYSPMREQGKGIVNSESLRKSWPFSGPQYSHQSKVGTAGHRVSMLQGSRAKMQFLPSLRNTAFPSTRTGLLGKKPQGPEGNLCAWPPQPPLAPPPSTSPLPYPPSSPPPQLDGRAQAKATLGPGL